MKEFLPYLQGLAAKGRSAKPTRTIWKTPSKSTQDASKDVEKAAKGNGAASGAAQTSVRLFAFSFAEKSARLDAAFPAATAFFSAFLRALDAKGGRRNFKWSCIRTPILRTRCVCAEDMARVRLSDILQDAPMPVIEAAAAILLGADVSPPRAA